MWPTFGAFPRTINWRQVPCPTVFPVVALADVDPTASLAVHHVDKAATTIVAMLDVRLRTVTSLVASAFDVASAVEAAEGWTVQRPVRGDLLQVAKPRAASLDQQLVRLDRDLYSTDEFVRIRSQGSLNDEFISARAFHSITRFATSLAQLRNSIFIEEVDIREAVRLLEVSKADLTKASTVSEELMNCETSLTLIFRRLENELEMPLGELETFCFLNGVSRRHLEEFLVLYVALDVIEVVEKVIKMK